MAGCAWLSLVKLVVLTGMKPMAGGNWNGQKIVWVMLPFGSRIIYIFTYIVIKVAFLKVENRSI